jgi:hypothetical protein
MQNKRALADIGLRYNPFEPRNYTDLPKTFVDRARSRDRALGMITDAIEQNSPKIIFIMGESGFGKKALLREIEYIIRGKGLEEILLPKALQNSPSSQENIIKQINQLMELKDQVKALREAREALLDVSSGIVNLENYTFSIDLTVTELLNELEISLSRLEKLEIVNKKETEELKKLTFSKPKFEVSRKALLVKLEIFREKLRERLDLLIKYLEGKDEDESEKKKQTKKLWVQIKEETESNDLQEVIGYYYSKLRKLEQELRIGSTKSANMKKIQEIIQSGFLIVKWTPEPSQVKDVKCFLKSFIEEIINAFEKSAPGKRKSFLANFKNLLKAKVTKPQVLNEYKDKLTAAAKETTTRTYTKAGIMSLIETYVEIEETEKVDPEPYLSKITEELLKNLAKYFGLLVFLFDDVFVFGGKKKTDIRVKMTKLIDSSVIPLVCYFGVPWTNRLHKLYSGFAERSFPIDLHEREMFEDTDFINFIEAKLSVARLPGLTVEDPLHPFTKQAIRLIFDNTMKVPLYIEYICREGIESLRETEMQVVTPDIAKESIQRGWKWIWRNELRPVDHDILLALSKLKEANTTSIAKETKRKKPNVSRALSSLDRRMILTTSQPKKGGRGAPGVRYRIRIRELENALVLDSDKFR